MFNLSEKEKEILKFWQEKNIFKKTLEKNSPQGDFVFYDGPPFATGTPHYGHIVASLMKDIVPRYWTMKGYNVERKWGWDTHGLPIENIVEQEIGTKSKKDIEDYGIDKFNESCRSKVMMYADEWRKVVDRMGRWVDMDNDYKTMDKDYMESIWWVFKQLWDKGLIYEGYKSMHICPRCETTLSQSEVTEGYKDVKDISVTTKFKLKTKNEKLKDIDGDIFVLAWTTTPWTLPGNVALAVGEDIDYVVYSIKNFSGISDGVYINSKTDQDEAKSIIEEEKKKNDKFEIKIIKEIKGKDLEGLKYEPLFDYYLSDKKADEVLNLKEGKKQATAPVIVKDGKILLGLREYSKSYDVEDDFWVGPGGRSEEGETLRETLSRELEEECGVVDYKIKKYLDSNPSHVAKETMMHWFLIEPENFDQIKNGEPEKFKEWRWFEIDKIPEEIPHKSDVEYFKQAIQWNNLYTIVTADFVTTEDGTGVVHIAPAFGEDDMNLGKAKNLPFIQHVGMDGRFKPEVTDFAGEEVKSKDDPQATDVKVLKYLAEKDLLFSKEKYEHSYPHCWRCDSPLLNYATSSWFVNVEKIKPKALETAKNINWVPEHIKEGRFGQWLEGARDWSISRQRFWGSVMPIWVCNECGDKKVIGSVEELENLSGEKIEDLHKHHVDKITFKCECGKGKMERIPDVLDCWFESGSMPYAQMHYPFENKEKFEKNFPAQFIAEGVDQTRAWFYYMHILANGIKETHAFNNVIVNGIVLAEDGKKMSKKLQNYPDPMDLMEKYGADKMRYYLCASQVMKADNFNFSEKDMEEQTRFFNTLMNVLSFYQMFAKDLEIENLQESDLVNVLDKWIIARLEETKKKITEKLDKYDLHAVREIPVFIDDLSTWYVRRSRDRLKGEDEKDKMSALKTLRRVLFHFARMISPFMPFVAEHVYKELNGNLESVHLEDWPEVRDEWLDQKVLEYMTIIRKVVELGLAERSELKIKVRQPLKKLSIFNVQFSKEYEDLVKEELNVKEVVMEKAGGDLSVKLDTEITPELQAEGNFREIVRTLNGMRKKQGLTIEDRIKIEYNSESEEMKKVFVDFDEDLKKQTLTDEILESNEELEKIKVNGVEVGIKITKV